MNFNILLSLIMSLTIDTSKINQVIHSEGSTKGVKFVPFNNEFTSDRNILMLIVKYVLLFNMLRTNKPVTFTFKNGNLCFKCKQFSAQQIKLINNLFDLLIFDIGIIFGESNASCIITSCIIKYGEDILNSTSKVLLEINPPIMFKKFVDPTKPNYLAAANKSPTKQTRNHNSLGSRVLNDGSKLNSKKIVGNLMRYITKNNIKSLKLYSYGVNVFSILFTGNFIRESCTQEICTNINCYFERYPKNTIENILYFLNDDKFRNNKFNKFLISLENITDILNGLLRFYNDVEMLLEDVKKENKFIECSNEILGNNADDENYCDSVKDFIKTLEMFVRSLLLKDKDITIQFNGFNGINKVGVKLPKEKWNSYELKLTDLVNPIEYGN